MGEKSGSLATVLPDARRRPLTARRSRVAECAVRWRYIDRTAGARVRSASIVVNEQTGRVTVRLSAGGGTLPLSAGDAPLGIRVLVDAAEKRCGALTFNPSGGARPKCTFSRSDTSVQCR